MRQATFMRTQPNGAPILFSLARPHPWTVPAPSVCPWMQSAEELRRKRVLVVEDDPTIGPLISDILNEAGFRTMLVVNGHDAVATAGRELPDVITLDLMLPGLSGDRILEALRANPQTAHIPVVIISAYGQGSPGAIAKAEAFISKPFDVDDLIETVVALARRSAGPGPQKLLS